MIYDALAALGAIVALRQIVSAVRWRFMVNRDGGSGRYGHWSVER